MEPTSKSLRRAGKNVWIGPAHPQFKDPDPALQTRLESLIEAAINIMIGFWISAVANVIILPAVGLPVNGHQVMMIGLFMTVVSVARQYIIRRWAQAHLRRAKVAVAASIRRFLNA